MPDLLSLAERTWYGWQLLPGYGDGYERYYSPIFVRRVQPLKSGRGLLRLEFINVLYAEGVQGFSVDLRVLDRHRDFLIAKLPAYQPHRSAIVSRISLQGIRKHVPGLRAEARSGIVDAGPEADPRLFLNKTFFGAVRPEPETQA